MPIEIRVLDPGEANLLADLASEVFDYAVDPRWCREFFQDPRHHLAVALDGRTVVGMASGVHYVHPDKPPELFINEVGVAASHRGNGLGRRLVITLCAHARALGCREAWVLTDDENRAAMRMYAAAGGTEQPIRSVMFTFPLDGGSSS